MKRKKPILMLWLTLVSAVPLIVMATVPESQDDQQVSQSEQRKFAALAERFGVRTEDWFVAYFYKPKDVVHDTAEKGTPEEFIAI